MAIQKVIESGPKTPMPVEALLVEEGEGGDHEGDGAGDDEHPADGAHPTCHLTHP